ncbi:MAG: HEPN domain-containing protein [Nitrospinae bacterium]|nr:HEPN domain-containing protein [Nitrospinota bacterium]
MDNANAQEAGKWLYKAYRDLGAAKRLIYGDDKYPDLAVYLCQQAVEKALKAFLTHNGASFGKTHNLSVLTEQRSKLDTSFEELYTASEILTPYATSFRYPSEVMEPYEADVAEALNLATKVVLKI